MEEIKEIRRAYFDKFYKDADWLNISDYPDDDASPDRWAWEFLKRNEKFSEATNALLKEYASMDRENTPLHTWRKWKDHCRTWGIGSNGISFYPIEWVNESSLDAPCRFKSSGPDLIHYDMQFGKNPTSSDPVYAIVEEKPDTQLIRFDLTKPIPPQIAAASQYLEMNYRGEKSKLAHSVKKFRLYLRAFDGYSQTKNEKVLIEQFSKEAGPYQNQDFEQNVPNWIERAKAYIERDYLEIPMQFNAEYLKKKNAKLQTENKTKSK